MRIVYLLSVLAVLFIHYQLAEDPQLGGRQEQPAARLLPVIDDSRFLGNDRVIVKRTGAMDVDFLTIYRIVH